MSNPEGYLTPVNKQFYCEVAAWILAGLVLIFVLKFRILAALLAGLLVYELVHILAPLIRLRNLSDSRARIIAVALLSSAVVALLCLMILGAITSFEKETGSLPLLLKKMAEIIESSRAMLPQWVVEHIPENTEELKQAAVEWLRVHASELQVVGKEAGRVFAHILIGMIIGAMLSLRKAVPHEEYAPLSGALAERARKLSTAFRRVVFAQVRIAALNTIFTSLYLAVILPMLGINLPFLKTLIAVTFFAGLLPVLGNLISNTVIVVVSLSYSLPVAISSLVFLIVIHKLEYFLNARIVGTQIRSKAWELLLAMISMEAIFGVGGLIAAPIYYAYLKDELADRKLI